MSKLWITYAWADNTEGDFDYLVRALQEIDVKSIYDRVAHFNARWRGQPVFQKISGG